MHFRRNAIISTHSTKFEIHPTIFQFKTVQNFFNRCHSKTHFSCFRMLYFFIMENIPAHLDLFQFMKILPRYSTFLINWL